MKTLSYEGLQFHYANDCKLCHGMQSIVDADNIRRECLCQKLARQKWRLEQVQIRPNSLKYKDWSDFNGTIEANGEIIGNLTLESALSGRDKAFRYCFGKAFDAKLLKNKSSHLYIQKHVTDGQNIIITGDSGSGRSLLAVLILKEVICASSFLPQSLDYRWVEAYDLIHGARWQASGVVASKNIDYDYLDHLSGLDFLFLEGVGIQTRGHNTPPDHFVLDKLFGHRRSASLPTVLTCSKELLKLAMGRNPRGFDPVHQIYGSQFLEVIRDSNNIVIDLEKENAS